MNTRFQLYLVRNLRNSKSGFALPLAIMIGLIIVGGGITMISLSQEDQSKAVSQKARADGLRGTEAGLARVQEYLNTVRVMAKVNSHCESGDCWATARVPSSGATDLTPLQKELNALNTSASCSDPSRANIISTTLDQMRDNLSTPETRNPIANGEQQLFLYYDIKKYEYKEIPPSSALASNLTRHIGTGILTLEGRSRRSALRANAPTDNSESRNRLVVSIPVLASFPVAFNRTTAPALWIQDGGIENSGETSGITVSNPEYSRGSKFQGDVVMSDPNAFRDNANVLRSKLECFINRDKLVQPSPAVNPSYQSQFFSTLSSFPPLPTISSNVPDTQKNLDLTESTTFPRRDASNVITDIPSPRTINGQPVDFYEYDIKSIQLDGNKTITITPGQKVIFFVRGPIQMAGNSRIEHECGNNSGCIPENFQIFADNTAATPDPQICLPIATNDKLEAFIFAPQYRLGIKGGGQMTGAMWGKSWGKIDGCQENNNTAIVQGVNWDNLLVSKPDPLKEIPQIGRILAWCEEAIDTTNSQCVPRVIRALGSEPVSEPESE